MSKWLVLLDPHILGGTALVLGLVAIIIGAILTETLPPVSRWIRARSGYCDPGQSPAVQAYAAKLGSRRRSVRLTAVERLGDLNDRTAVPALLKYIARNQADGLFLESVVQTLAHLGDDRALPALRELSHGKHLRLMEEARAAIGLIEPRSVLLRASEKSAEAQANELLRAAASSNEELAEQLLRLPSA